MVREDNSKEMVIIVLIAIGLGLISLNKPVHIDETNFLSLMEGTFGAPHNTRINWQGTEQRAFEVLSNPAGIAWFLWLFKPFGIVGMRLSMLLWTPIVLISVGRIASFFDVEKRFLVLLTLFSPIVFISQTALTPDMPLLGLYLAGVAGVLHNKRCFFWAFVGGCAVLFRYSGASIIPLFIVLGLIFHSRKKAIALGVVGSIPFFCLFVHDILVYGKWHFGEMIFFQQAEKSFLIYKAAAFLAMLSGAVCLPMVRWNRYSLWFLSLSVVFSAISVSLAGMKGWIALWSFFWVASGLYVVFNTVRISKKKGLFLSIWFLGGVVFLCMLRFAATRYWLPFFLPALIQIIKPLKFWEKMVLLCTTMVLSIFLAQDDFEFAVAHKQAAISFSKIDKGSFGGHWGWQYYMEQNGWKAIEDDQPLEKGLYATIDSAWPQEPLKGCLEHQKSIVLFKKRMGPRIHTREGRANIHSFLIYEDVLVFTPWSFGGDAYVRADLFLSCS